MLGVVAVGGGLLGLGYVLAWPALPDVALGRAPVEEPATLAAGAVLGLLGTYTLGAGLLGVVHKLVADGVAAGVKSAEVTAGGTAAPAGEDGTVDSDVQPAEAPVSGDRTDSGFGSRPDPGSDREDGPETGSVEDGPETGSGEDGPGTDSGEGAPGVGSPADGTDGTATGQATSAAGDAGAGGAGPDSTGATGRAHRPAELDDWVGPSEGSDPEPATGAAGGTDSGESGTVTPDSDTAGNPDPSAVTGPHGAGDSTSTRPEDLETEPVDVEASDTVPVEADGQPAPGDVGVDDVGSTDRPADSSSNPPEPSPEEIAFGSSAGDTDREGVRDAGADTGSEEGTVTERADWFDQEVDGETDGESDAGTSEKQTEGTEGVDPAGSTASSDPLADPNETE